MSFVLDASVAASWAFPDEAKGAATKALDRLRTDEAHVPSLWWFEIRNTLIAGERRNRISLAATTSFLSDLDYLKIIQDRTPQSARVPTIARHYKLSVYDAAYVELAERMRLPLATLDRALHLAASQAGVASFIG